MASAPCPGAVGFSASGSTMIFAGVEHGAQPRARTAANSGPRGFEQPVDVGLGHDQRGGVAVHELREARFAIAARQHEGDARRFGGQRPLQEARTDSCAGARTRTTRAARRASRSASSRFTSSRSRVSARGSVAAMCVSGLRGERQVLPEMHGDVDGVGAQRDAQIAGEPAAPQQLGQRRVELAIAGRSRGRNTRPSDPVLRASSASPTRRACTCASTLARAPNTMGLSRVISLQER